MENKKRKELLTELIVGYFNDLSEEDLYKLLLLVKNTEQDRRVVVNKPAAPEPPMKNRARFNDKVNVIPTAKDPELKRVYDTYMDQTITQQLMALLVSHQLATAPYGIFTALRTVERSIDFLSREGSEEQLYLLDVFFGYRGVFDAVISVDFTGQYIHVSAQHVNPNLRCGRFTHSSKFGESQWKGLLLLAENYKVTQQS